LRSNRVVHRIGTSAGSKENHIMTVDLFFTRPEGRLAFTDQGSGPLVVMVPGLGDLKEEYRFLAPKVVDAGYRVVTTDLRGLGNSSVGWPAYTNAALGSDIVALIRFLGVSSATVIGTSMGAGAAAWAAAEAPDVINDLVLIGPFVRVLPPGSWWKGAAMKAAFAGPWANMMWASYWTSLYPTAKPADFPAYKAALLANLKEPGRMAATKAMIAAPKADVGDRLVEVRARTLVVMGSKDPDFPDAATEAATVAKLLRGTVAMVPGAGHYPHAEMPDITVPLVTAFLKGRKHAA
jgi:pimeloyl-ACP methyl ester carboxylesterase